MSERSEMISKLVNSADSRASYIRGKLNVLIPSQLKALRLRHVWTQGQFAKETGMKQSRVSAMEQPGATNFTVETLVRSAAVLGVGIVVKFVPLSEMLAWENGFSQDQFDPAEIRNDDFFLSPATDYPFQAVNVAVGVAGSEPKLQVEMGVEHWLPPVTSEIAVEQSQAGAVGILTS